MHRVGALQDGGLDEEALAVVGRTAGQHRQGRVGGSPAHEGGEPVEGTPVDDGPAEVRQVGDVAVGEGTDPVGKGVAQARLPERARHIGPRRRAALLPLVLESSSYEGDLEGGDVSRRVGEDEVLTAGLTHQAGVGPVAADVGSDLPPQVLEGRGRAGEVDAGEVGVLQRDGRRRAEAGDQVDDSGWHAGRLEQAHRVVGGELLGRRRLPDDGVAHERRGQWQVARDGGEVERRDGEHEALERAVVHPVPHAVTGHRLLREDPPPETDVEAQEVDQLAGTVDLSLEDGLALAEHRRAVEGVAPRPGEQVGGLEHHGGPVVVRRLAPRGCCPQCGVDGCLPLLGTGLARRTEQGAVTVRLDHRDRLARRLLLYPVDRGRQVHRLACELLEPRLQGGPLTAAGSIGTDRFVDGCRDHGGGVEHRGQPLLGCGRYRVLPCCHGSLSSAELEQRPDLLGGVPLQLVSLGLLDPEHRVLRPEVGLDHRVRGHRHVLDR